MTSKASTGGETSAHLLCERTRRSAASRSGASFQSRSSNRKLAPRRLVRSGTRLRPTPIRPFCSSTSVSIAATCPESCPFKGSLGRPGACYERSGFTKFRAERLDEDARDVSGERVIEHEVVLIRRAFGGGPIPQDGARGGRDLRLHVGGEVPSTASARLLAAAAAHWCGRGGGLVWTFTHRWREIPRSAFGSISALASLERPKDIEAARERGYAAAIVVSQFLSRRAFRLAGADAKVIPCPAETAGTACVECRLCLDGDALLARGVAIGFEAHGPRAKDARELLTRIRRKRDPFPVPRASAP